jgi:uncharacterized membrane protein
VRLLRYALALAAVLVLVVLTAWALSWPFEKAAYLAPVILWGKVALESLRESRHPRRVLAYWLLGLGLLVLLTVLGVKFPSEGG